MGPGKPACTVLFKPKNEKVYVNTRARKSPRIKRGGADTLESNIKKISLERGVGQCSLAQFTLILKILRQFFVLSIITLNLTVNFKYHNSNEKLVIKILRRLNRSWQPKVTEICESKDLVTMDTHTLFEKLQEHEMEIKRVSIDEEEEKKTKSLVINADKSNSSGDIPLIVKNFKIFLRNEKKQKEEQEKDEEKTQFIPKCYNYGSRGHIRPYCPLDKNENQKKPMRPKKKKAYVALEDNDMESSDDEEEVNISLMENQQDDEGYKM